MKRKKKSRKERFLQSVAAVVVMDAKKAGLQVRFWGFRFSLLQIFASRKEVGKYDELGLPKNDEDSLLVPRSRNQYNTNLGIFPVHRNCWRDIFDAVSQTRRLVYITGWSA
ncbi:hypothetical protein KIW84_043651 [Lathyrus oleraceus]|uniref:Uncharacterized protein n=1 Tax=Pisum sativum TaxID=3888 RepID=A0A9D4XI15_PEA|nr:hypothetical protein KIW84_043649 [Pisum sativum]KAI5419565.1 hypothetical protein KIW84_043651 [Pisum sativum]